MTKYELVILTDRGRDETGNWDNHIFDAENDLEALINVSYMYEPQGKSIVGLSYDEDEEKKFYDYLRKLYKENKNEALIKAKKLLTCEDPTDYYDNVAYIENLESKENIFEDAYFVSIYEEDMDSIFDEDEEDDE